MLRAPMILLLAVFVAGVAAATQGLASPAPAIVTLTLCPASLSLTPGQSANVTGDAYNEANESVIIEPQATWASNDANASDGWRVASEPARSPLGSHAFHNVRFRVGIQGGSGARTNDTLVIGLLGAMTASGWTPLRIPVTLATTAATTNESACVRSAFLVPVTRPALPTPSGGGPAHAKGPPIALEWGLAAAGAASVAGLAAWTARSEDRWLRVVALYAPLFTRLAPSRLLDQSVRERIYTSVQDDPGVHFVELRDRLDLSTGVATHHLRILERNQLIASRREGRYRAYYPLTAKLPPAPAAPLNATARQLLDTIEQEKQVAFAALPARLGVSKSTVSYNVKLLSQRGLVELVEAEGVWVVRDARAVTVRPSS